MPIPRRVGPCIRDRNHRFLIDWRHNKGGRVVRLAFVGRRRNVMRFGSVIPTWRWALRVGVILAAAYAVLVGITAYDDQRTRREWADACAEADQLDPNWRWDDLLAALPA